MIWQKNKTNIALLNQKYQQKRFLQKKDFYNLNPSFITFSNSLNQELNNNNNNQVIAGTVLESGFFGLGHKFVSNRFFRDNTKNFPYNKINKWVIENKVLNEKQMQDVYFKLSETKSFICFAGAGSGKTTGIVLPTIIANSMSPSKPNLLITDPKGELAKSTFDFLKKQGYDVACLNILDTDNTDCFSPFTLVKEMLFELAINYDLNSMNLNIEQKNKKYELLNTIDSELKEIIFSLDEKENSSISDFWDRQALVAIHNISWLIIDDLLFKFKNWFKDNEKLSLLKKKEYFFELFIAFSFQSIYFTMAQFGGNDGRKKYIEFYKDKFNVDLFNISIEQRQDHVGIIRWNQLWRDSEKSRTSFTEDILSNALLMLEKFNHPSLKKMTMFNTFDFDKLYGENQKPFALFVTIDNSQPATIDYVSWFINYCLMKTNSFATRGSRVKLKKPLMCIFEEIGNIKSIKNLPVTVNEGRGKNIFVSLFFQTYEQYEQKYKNNSGGFMRSCAYRVLLTNAEGRFVKEIVDYAGEFELINKKTYQAKKVKRLTENDVYSLPKFRALILQNDINVPYISSLIPFQLFGINSQQKLNIPLPEKYKHKMDVIYNPLSTLSQKSNTNNNNGEAKSSTNKNYSNNEKLLATILGINFGSSNISYVNEILSSLDKQNNKFSKNYFLKKLFLSGSLDAFFEKEKIGKDELKNFVEKNIDDIRYLKFFQKIYEYQLIKNTYELIAKLGHLNFDVFSSIIAALKLIIEISKQKDNDEFIWSEVIDELFSKTNNQMIKFCLNYEIQISYLLPFNNKIKDSFLMVYNKQKLIFDNKQIIL